MADFSSIMMSKATSSSGNGNWDGAGGLDQITVVRIDDTHIVEDDEAAACYEVEYSVPEEEEEEVIEEEEEDGVYVIEYSNPEEEGESYQFTMSVDRSLPAKQVEKKAPLPAVSKPFRPQRPRQKRKQEVKKEKEEAKKKKEEEVVSNKCVLALGEDYSDIMGMNSDKKQLMCTFCPPPGRLFKRAAGLAVHLKHMHLLEGKKTFFCTMCQQSVRSQVELDAHTKRHANQDAVFTCLLCKEAGGAGYKGSKWGLRKHLETEHPGVIPRCDICNKGFLSLASYLADQFRHVGVSPYYCARCQIYEMTERGLNVHIRNDNKKQKQLQESEEKPQESEEKLQESEEKLQESEEKLQESEEKLQESEEKLQESEEKLQALEASANSDNSATDDSDF